MMSAGPPDTHLATGDSFPLRLRRRLQRSLGSSGGGRAALIQSTKASLAALLAWVVAAEVLHFSQPFLAPWSAIFIVAATVYRSVRSAAQQFSAAVVAVVLASAAGALIPWELLTLFLAVLIGLLIGQWRWFGDSGTWIGITALLILTSGAMEESMLVDRLIETAIGAVIGIVVNATISPPLYQVSAREAVRSVSEDLAEALTDMAAAAHEKDLEPPDISLRAREAIVLMRRAEQAVLLDDESRRLNLRLRAQQSRDTDLERKLVRLRHAWSYVEALGKALQASRSSAWRADPRSSTQLSTMLDHLAELVRCRCDTSATSEDLERTAENALSTVDSAEHQIDHSTAATSQRIGTLPITAPARHLIRELAPA